MKTKMINDEQSLVSAKFGHGTPIAVYDDGYGPLFIHRDSMGISGIVRARTWEDAYSICEDEFFPAGDEEASEEYERIEAMEDGEDKNHEQACWDESYGYRGNSRHMPDGSTSSIYAKDLNGDSLTRLTPELVEHLGIILEITDPAPEPEPVQRFFLWHLQRRLNKTGRAYTCSWSGRYGTMGSRVYPGSHRRLVRNEHTSPTWENFSFQKEES